MCIRDRDCDYWNCSSGESCCGGECYNTSTSQCCDQSTGHTCLIGRKCCNGATKSQSACCNTSDCKDCTYREASESWWCPECGGDPCQLCCEGEETCYDIETKDCCDDLKIYDIATEKCCNEDTGHTCPKSPVDKTCCDGACYDPETEKCCNPPGPDNGYKCPESPVDFECCHPSRDCCDPTQCEECIDGECECAVEIDNVSGAPSSLPPGCPAVFIVSTVPGGREDCVEWSGGGNPANQSGGVTFHTSWDSLGLHTVRATSKCDSSYYDEDSVMVEYRAINDQSDLDNCTNRVTDPGYGGPVPNGCSSPYGNNPTRDCPYPPTCFGTNEDCVNTSFLGPCNTHDTCYGTCNGTGGYGKYSCDVTFGADMHVVCNALTGDEYDSCYDDCDWWADTYAIAVYLVGQSAYDNGQIAACSCADCW